MQTIKFYTYILLLYLIASSGMVLPQTRTIRPSNPKDKFIIRESGVNHAYYLVRADDPSIIFIKGPGKLRITSRIIIPRNTIVNDYNLLYRIDGGERKNIYYDKIKKSKNGMINGISTGVAGIGKVLNIELGPGEHSLEIRSGSASVTILAKYSFRKIKAKKTKWVMLSPSHPNEPVDLVIHENVVHYYRFSERKPLKININGPTTLRILTRFENHYNMKGRINYRIQVKQDNQVLNTYLLSSIYSEVTTYRHNLKLVPGKAREFYIQVPPGRHRYTIIPMDKDKNTILARILFPKKDVKLEY